MRSLKRWLWPHTFGGWVVAIVLLLVVACAWAYSARDGLYRTYLGLQPEAQNVGKAAYAAGERLEMEKSANGARVTLTSVYAQETHVVVGYEVEDLTRGRRAGGHPAELQPLLGFGDDRGKLRKAGLGTDVVGLTDESGTEFRMVDNSGQTADGPENVATGPLQNMVAFKPAKSIASDEKHRFRLTVPLVQSPVVQMGQKQPTDRPFPGKPFVFDFEVPVQPVRSLDVGQKVTAEGVTLTLDRVIDSAGMPQAVICYGAPDDGYTWTLWGGKGTDGGGWGSGSTGSMKIVSSKGCQRLQLKGPIEGPSSFEVEAIEGSPICTMDRAKKAEKCFNKTGERRIRGPWRFGFDAPVQ